MGHLARMQTLPFQNPAPSDSFEHNINKLSLRIVNIVENQVFVYYSAERFLQYFGSISEQ